MKKSGEQKITELSTKDIKDNIKQSDYLQIVTNSKRHKLIKLCLLPQTIKNLKFALNISTGDLYHHLKILEKFGVIKKTYVLDKNGNKLKGRQTAILTDLEKWREIQDKTKKEEVSKWESFSGRQAILEEEIIKPLTYFVLKILDNESILTEKELTKKMKDAGINWDDYVDEYTELVSNGEYIDTYYKINDKGKRWIKQNKEYSKKPKNLEEFYREARKKDLWGTNKALFGEKGEFPI
jgi:hypothetical protein